MARENVYWKQDVDRDYIFIWIVLNIAFNYEAGSYE